MHHATYQFWHGSQVLPYGVSSLETGSCYLQSVPELVIGLQHTRKKMKTQKASRKGRKIAYEKLNSTPQSESNLKSQFWQAERMVENERI